MKQIFRKTIFFLLGSLFCGTSWADDILVPSPVYFNDFSTAVKGQDGIDIIGNGVFENDADARFGRIFHNDPTNASAVRTNYLKLPTNVLSHSATSKEMTIGFWVNKKGENDFWFMPLFTAYGAAPVENANTWPMFACQARGLLQVNCAGWCNFDNTDNDNSTNYEGTYWLDDGAWHYYSVALTETTAKVYVDGSIVNSWTVDKSEGHNISGLFTNGSELTYVCLGGNQSWDWNNADPAFGFDDFAVYNVELSKAQIDQIIANKLNRTVTGTKIGSMSCGTAGLGAMTTKMTLYPGTSYSYRFINYNNGGTDNYRNFLVPVYNPDNDLKISVRADNWENMHNVGGNWGSNAGCSSNFNWTNWMANMNGATVDMTVTFTTDKVFNMSSTIHTVDGSTWNYSYRNNYDSSPIDLTSYDYVQVALSVENSWLDLLSTSTEVYETINVLGWSTYASDYALDFTSEIDGLTPYIVTNHTGSAITLSKVTTTVPAGTPLLLKGTAGTSYTIPVAASSDTDVSSNKLVRGTGSAVSYEAENTKYVLSASGSDPVFKKIVDGTPATVPTNKAYLQFNGGISARELTFDFNDDITGVNEVRSQKEQVKGEYFNIAGQRVAQPTKGLYIVNGKKVVIR